MCGGAGDSAPVIAFGIGPRRSPPLADWETLMKKPAMTAADARREADRKKDKQFIRDKEKERQSRLAKTEKLRLLRLAKEEAEIEEKAAATAAKAAKSAKKTARPKAKASGTPGE